MRWGRWWESPDSGTSSALSVTTWEWLFRSRTTFWDYTGSEDVTGKPTGLDLRERKVTLPLVGAMREMSASETDQVRHLFTMVEPTDDDVDGVVDIVRRRGGLEYARGRALEYAEAAEAALSDLPPGDAVGALRDSIGYAVDRSR